MPISTSGPIRVSDILTAKGFRTSNVPSFLPDLSDQTTRSPDANQSFTKLFTQNRLAGPDATQPHSLSEWRGVGNEVTVPTAVGIGRVGNNVRVTWTTGTTGAYTAVLLMRVDGYDSGDPIIIPTGYVVAAETTAPIGATSVDIPMSFIGPYTYRALVSHYWTNTFFDAGSGFQSPYVLATGSVFNSSGSTSTHPYAAELYMASETLSGAGAQYQGWTLATRCTFDLSTRLDVWMDTPTIQVGTQFYANNTGTALAPIDTVDAGGPYVHILDGLFLQHI
jgi:hypothetical protein